MPIELCKRVTQWKCSAKSFPNTFFTHFVDLQMVLFIAHFPTFFPTMVYKSYTNESA